MKEQIVQFKNNILIVFIFFISFILDRISKVIIINFLLNNNLESFYFNSFLNFVLVWNKGIAFGLLDTESFFYHIISVVIFFILCFLFFLLIKSKFLYEKFSYALIMGGASGNFFDRLYYEAVPDFIDFHYKGFHWFTFNVSDIWISVGVFFLIMFELKPNNIKNEK